MTLADTETREGVPSQPNDMERVADFIVQEYRRRKTRRHSREALWKEVDRQIAMTPDPKIKANRPKEAVWMPNMELPWQAQALEILTADTRRLMFPDQRDYFSAHAALTDEYLRRVDFKSIIAGDENDVPSSVTQDDADALVEGAHQHFQSLYDYRGAWDQMSAEALKYGEFAGRGLLVKHEDAVNEARGVSRDSKKIPILAPMSVKHTYPDDAPQHAIHEGFVLNPAMIREYWMRWDDLVLAAKSGGRDPESMEGGWFPDGLKTIDPDGEQRLIHLLEYEGDLVVPKSDGSSVWFNVIVTVALGGKDTSGAAAVVRWREGNLSYSSYITGSYHKEGVGHGSTSPLMKGQPLQRAATIAFNNMMSASWLNVEPPIRYDPDDPHFAANGGPTIAPRALWPTTGAIEPIRIGQINDQLAVYSELLRQYQELTGVNSVRSGGQTKSHQSAFAVDQEQQRGQVRTVDFVRSVNHSAMVSWLNMEFDLIKQSLDKPEMVFLPKYNGYVDISAEQLPDKATYDVHGVSGPLEEAEKRQRRNQAYQTVLQLEPLARQVPDATPLDLDTLRRDILRDGGVTDVDKYITAPPTGSFDQSAVAAGVQTNSGILPVEIPQGITSR